MHRMYFGHPINTYNTPLEDRLLGLIHIAFGGWQIENPNQPHHQRGYREWKEKTGSGMNYFLEEVLPLCDAGVFLPFKDGAWGAGVFKEARCLADLRKQIFQITAAGMIAPVSIFRVPELSVDQTRARVYAPNGELLPYG